MRRLACLMLAVGMVGYAAGPPARWQKKLGPEQQVQVDELRKRIGLAARTKRFEEAAALTEQIVRVREQWQGSRHRETVTARSVAEQWRLLQKVPEARREEIVRSRALQTQADALLSKNQVREAEQKFREALDIYRGVLGEEHPGTGGAYARVAQSVHRSGEREKALPVYEKGAGRGIPLLERLLNILRKVQGENHPDTAQAYYRLATTLHTLGQTGKSLSLLEKSLAIYRNTRGDNDPVTACTAVAVAVPSGTMLARMLRDHRPLRAENLLAVGNTVFTPPEYGLLVLSVTPGEAAARVGIQAGDVLLSVGERRLHALDDLKRSTSGRVGFWRDGREGVTTRELSANQLGVYVDAPAAQAVARWRERTTSVVLRGTGHKALPATAFEVRSLAALVKNSTMLLGSEASEQELDRLRSKRKLERFRILHFATHGETDEGDPDRCRLILAQDRLPDPLKQLGSKVYTGELTVKTIRRDWTLDADLVVLSACQTALGRDAGGDGLLGFAHAFLARGHAAWC